MELFWVALSSLPPQRSSSPLCSSPQIWCVVWGIPARAHVLSWYQQLMGNGPTFLLSQREGAPPTYGLGVNPRFLAEIDPAQNAARLTMGNTLLMRALSTAPCGFQDSILYLWRRYLSALSGWVWGCRVLGLQWASGSGLGKKSVDGEAPVEEALVGSGGGREGRLRRVDCWQGGGWSFLVGELTGSIWGWTQVP